jgi:hypothetical protein
VQYTLMFHMSPTEFSARADSEKKAAFWGAFIPYMQAVKAAGIFRGGAGLEAPESATTVRVQDGKRSVQDGPYVDSKEQLGGFFIIEAPDLDTALDWAARYPAGPQGVVEVRPNRLPSPKRVEQRWDGESLQAFRLMRSSYQPYWAVAAHLLKRMQRASDAQAAYSRAIKLCEDSETRELLMAQSRAP